ncbi:MAG: type II toxin-antitoxin system mRNA interferase toxin, RelE/StbE family [Kiritimatiellae bacterium]|nr:type II toxin-antitoxin system mRNA interferase toxin, RelE/StbE family [Kiritimatiellia bacterium]
MAAPYTLVWTETFARTAKRFLRTRPALRNTLSEVLHRLEADPRDPALKLHALHGRLEGRQAVRLTYSYRIVLRIAVRGKEIHLLDIGSHDEVY